MYQTVTAAPSASVPSPAQTAPKSLAVGQAATLQDTSSGQTIGTLTVESANVTTQSADGSGTAPANG